MSTLWRPKWFLLPVLILILIPTLYFSYTKTVITNNINLFEWYWVGQDISNENQLRLVNNCKKISENCKPDITHILSASYNKKGKIIKHKLKSRISKQKKSSTNLLVQPRSENSVFLTYRLEILNGKKGIRTIIKQIRSDIKILKKANVMLAGIEFSYDSPSSKLLDYVDWLESFKQSLDKIPYGWTVQIQRAFVDKKNAERLIRNVHENFFYSVYNKQHQTIIKSIKQNNNILYQVVIGPLNNIQYASELQKWIEYKYGYDYPTIVLETTSSASFLAPLWITGLPAWHTDKPTYLHELTQVVDGISFQLYETDKNIVPNQNLIEFVKGQKNAHIGLYCFDKKILSDVLLELEPERNISVGIFNNATCL